MAGKRWGPGSDGFFTMVLRDINPDMVAAWKDSEAFGEQKFASLVEVSCGDIFEGAPAADAIVSPANSFGFMDGGIDMVYSLHFGWGLPERLQDLLRKEYSGELPVGCAVVVPTYPDFSKLVLSPSANEGQPIRHLVSAPTMRIPCNVSKTANAYLAFRAVLRAVLDYNRSNSGDKIHRVLCPGLGTAVGRMPYKRCAIQMRTAYDAVLFGSVHAINSPASLSECCTAHVNLVKAGGESGTAFGPKAELGELFLNLLDYNRSNSGDKIRRVLCPGLGTAVGRMPYKRCAIQMRTAYDAVLFGSVHAINSPASLSECCTAHVNLVKAGGESGTAFGPKAELGELFLN